MASTLNDVLQFKRNGACKIITFSRCFIVRCLYEVFIFAPLWSCFQKVNYIGLINTSLP